MKSQRLVFPKSGALRSPARVLEEVFGIQAQDWRSALLSIRARSSGLTAENVERTLQGERSAVRTWCIRGTLHLVTVEDARWLIPLMGPALIQGDQRRMAQLGWDEASAAAGIRLVQKTLGAQGELTRNEIRQLLREHNLPSEGQAPVHLILRAALEGILFLGLDQGKDSTYFPIEPWVGKLEPLPREKALARIAHRYLEAYGPAGPAGLASWSGLKLGEARAVWDMIVDEIVPVEMYLGDRLKRPASLLKTRLPWLDKLPERPGVYPPIVRLLPRYDTYLLGYESRELVVNPIHARRVHPGGGIIHPVLLVDGEALGVWGIERRKNHLEVRVEPFEELTGELKPLIEAEVADTGRFLEEEARLVMRGSH